MALELVGQEGDVILPAQVVETLALLDGDTLEFVVDDDCVLLRRMAEGNLGA